MYRQHSFCSELCTTWPIILRYLRSEVLRVVGREEKMVTPTHISNMPYFRNCVKGTSIGDAQNHLLYFSRVPFEFGTKICVGKR